MKVLKNPTSDNASVWRGGGVQANGRRETGSGGIVLRTVSAREQRTALKWLEIKRDDSDSATSQQETLLLRVERSTC